jgi:hypothetical protein
MRVQLLSDLHLETEDYAAEPAAGAELLVLAGDIDSRWSGLEQFRHWPVPVLFVAGNHEYDHRDILWARDELRQRCAELGLRMLESESLVLADTAGRRVRFVATTRWCDFDLFGPSGRDKAMRAAGYYLRLMHASRDGVPLDARALRGEALTCAAWLRSELQRPNAGWDATVVVTHFAPSARSADPRYGTQPGTASFCNADDDLLRYAQLWIHGHLHCQFDYHVPHATGSTRIVCNARGHARKGEALGHRPQLLLEV